MCRSHVQGYRRCKSSAATKAQESLRKSINYQAKKAGISPEEWKNENPDLLEMIKNTYDERLHRFQKQLGEDCEDSATEEPEVLHKPALSFMELAKQKMEDKKKKKADAWEALKAKPKTKENYPSIKEGSAFSDAYFKDKEAQDKETQSKLDKITKEFEKEVKGFDHYSDDNDDISGFINAEGETMLTGIQSPADAAKKKPIATFAAPGEKRTANTHLIMEDYLEYSRDYCKNLKFNKDEERAILCYTNDTFVTVNKYLLNRDLPSYTFDDTELPWKEETSEWFSSFKNEEDLVEYTQSLDTALSHRAEEERIVYRGMKVREDSQAMLDANDGKPVLEEGERKRIMENMYQPGAEMNFDAYTSTSESIDIAANWSGIHGDQHWPVTSLLFEIKSSAGIPVAHISGHDNEREILMPRGMRFRVEKSYWNKADDDACYSYWNTYYNSTEMNAKNENTLIVQLVEIDENGKDVPADETTYNTPQIPVRTKGI